MKLLSFFGPPLYSLEVRPEKDHAAQIRMMSWLRMRYPEHRQSMRLLLVGGVRNEGDSARVKELKELADSLQVSVSGRPSRRSLIYGAIGANDSGIRRFCGKCTISTHLGAPRRGQHRRKHDGR
jgi:hypothetical protein